MPCSNCEALERSCGADPAVPLGRHRDDVLHVCPNDGQRWHQTDTASHAWEKVDSDGDWDSLVRKVRVCAAP